MSMTQGRRNLAGKLLIGAVLLAAAAAGGYAVHAYVKQRGTSEGRYA